MKKNDGFTLIEVLVSIVILGMLLTSFFQSFVFSQKTTMTNKEKLVAVNIAQNVLEQIKDGTYPEITDKTQIAGVTYPKTYNAALTCTQSDVAQKTACLKKYDKTEEQKNYSIQVEVGPVRENKLHTVIVNVNSKNGKTISFVKGVLEL